MYCRYSDSDTYRGGGACFCQKKKSCLSSEMNLKMNPLKPQKKAKMIKDICLFILLYEIHDFYSNEYM